MELHGKMVGSGEMEGNREERGSEEVSLLRKRG